MGIFRDFRDFRDFGGFQGFLRFLGISGILGLLEILGIFMKFLVEICESDFFGQITDASTKIWMCQPMRILLANKALMCGF